MPHIYANGLEFHVQVLPEDPPPGPTPRPKVVMIHGLVIDNLSSYYYTIANPLALEADTYLYDLRGHGRTDVPLTGYNVADHVEDLRGLIQSWQLIGQPVHFVGNSFGGVIALEYTRLFPEDVASLVLLEAHFATEGWAEHMAGSLALAAFGLDDDSVKDWLIRNGSRKLKRLARHSERLFEETSMIKDLQREEPFPYRALQAISCPTLAIYGAGSDILDRAYDLEKHIPGCELHIVPEGTHSVLSEATPFVRERTLDWIMRHNVVAAPTGAVETVDTVETVETVGS